MSPLRVQTVWTHGARRQRSALAGLLRNAQVQTRGRALFPPQGTEITQTGNSLPPLAERGPGGLQRGMAPGLGPAVLGFLICK